MKDVICSFASKGREPYNQYLLRLIDSALQHWHGDLLIYSPDHHLESYRGVKINKGWPQPKGIKSYTHAEMPYQFKTALIQEAIEKGYERIIWLDSSMILKKDLTPLFNGKNGITTFENLGHPVWKYIGKHAEEMLSSQGFINDDEDWCDVYKIHQIWGGAFAMDFSNSRAQYFFCKDKRVLYKRFLQ